MFVPLLVRTTFEFGEVDYDELFFRGILAPFLRASERPIAIACFRLFTVPPPLPPRPDLRVPLFLRRMALATVSRAVFPYLVLPGDFFLVAMGDLVKKRFKESFSTSLDPIILADGE